jgi:hypothetical protein
MYNVKNIENMLSIGWTMCAMGKLRMNVSSSQNFIIK